MSIIIRLQNLPWTANAEDIRRFFDNLIIPDGGVHIIGGEHGDAFIVFGSDEDARLAMLKDGGMIKNTKVKLLLSSRVEMQKVIDAAKQQALTSQNLIQTLAAATANQFDANALPMLPNVLSMLPALRSLPGMSGLPTVPPMPAVPTMPTMSGVPGTPIMSTMPNMSPMTNVPTSSNVTSTPMPVPAPAMQPKANDYRPSPSVITQTKLKEDFSNQIEKSDDTKMTSESKSRSTSRSRSKSRSRDRRNHRDRHRRERSRDRKHRRERSWSRGRDHRRERSRDRKYRHDRSWSKGRDQDTTRFNSLQDAPMTKTEKVETKQVGQHTEDPKFSFKMSEATNKVNIGNVTDNKLNSINETAKNQAEFKSNNVQTAEVNSLPAPPPQHDQNNMMNWWGGMIRPPMMPTWAMSPTTTNPKLGNVPETDKVPKNIDNNQPPNIPPIPYGMYPFNQGFPPVSGPMFPFPGTYPNAPIQPGMPTQPGVPPPGHPGMLPNVPYSVPGMMPTHNNSCVPNSATVTSASPSTINDCKKRSIEEAGEKKYKESKDDVDDNEEDAFGRKRRKHSKRFDSYSPPDSKNMRNYDTSKQNFADKRESRRSRFDNAYETRKFVGSKSSFDDEDSRGSRISQEDLPNKDDHRNSEDRKNSEECRHYEERRYEDYRHHEESYQRRNPYHRNYSRFDNVDQHSDSRVPSSDYSSNRFSRIYNSESQISTCVELQNVPLTATEIDVKKFFAPLPLFESCIKFQDENEDKRTRNVFIKFINANQKEQALQKSGLIQSSRVQVRDLSSATYEAAKKVNPITQIEDRYLKISFIPKRAQTEDVNVAFPDQPEEVLIMELKDRQSLVAYLKFSDIKAVQTALKDKHNIMICDSRVKLEAIKEHDFLKYKNEITNINNTSESNTNCENSDLCTKEAKNTPEQTQLNSPEKENEVQNSTESEVQQSEPENQPSEDHSDQLELQRPARHTFTPCKPAAVESFGKPQCVVALENVPYKADVTDIIHFFKSFNIVKENVIRRFNERGQPTGDFRVALKTPLDAQKAAKSLNGRTIFGRYISVKVV